MPASNEAVEVVTDDHLYTVAELYKRFGGQIPAYRWYVVHLIAIKGHIKRHIFTIQSIERNALGEDLFTVGLTIMDWAINPKRSIELTATFVGSQPVLVEIGDPPEYKVHSIITSRYI